MPIGDSLESQHEAFLSIQEAITNIKVLRDQADRFLDDKKYIKAYKRELEIEAQLRALAGILSVQEKACEKEANTIKENISIEAMKLKCKAIDYQMFDQENEYDDFGEE